MTLRRQIILLLAGLAAALVATVGLSTAAHADTTPSAPTNVSVLSWFTEGSNSSAYVHWTASSSNGGSALTYTVTPRIGGTPQTSLAVSTSDTTAEVAGLAPGTAYTFTVTATNVGNYSATSSASSSITTMTAAGAPTSVSASTSGTNATVNWTAPSSLGSGNFSTYVVEVYSGSTLVSSDYAATTSYTATSLTPGTAYTFKVITQTYDPATWNIAWSNPAGSNSVTPYVTPSAPTNVGVWSWFTEASDSSAYVHWTASTSTGGGSALSYTVTPRIGSTLQTGLAVTTADTTAEVTGLSPGTTYTFVVTATNAGNLSATSSPSTAITTMTAAGAPTSVTATTSGTNATATWTAPSSLGSGNFSTYVVEVYSGSTLVSSDYAATTSYTATSLTPGTAYSFKVTTQTYDPATWNIAWSSPAGSNSVTPYVAPAAPTDVSFNSWFTEGSSSSAWVRWVASSSTGGGSLTYTVTPRIGSTLQTGLAVTTTGTSVQVPGLTPGTTYTFVVTATNTGGQSATSSPSSAITTLTAAGAPTSASASASAGNVTVNWTAPSSLGSGNFSTYIVEAYNGSTLATSAYASGTSYTFTSLTPGTAYTFKVITQTYDPATWNIAWSTRSSATNSATPYVAPAAPTGVTLNSWFTEAGTSNAYVRWTASSSTGGGSLTYTLTPVVGGTPQTGLAVTTTDTSAVVDGLTPGTTYTFVVTATNTGGQSATSSASSAITTMTAAGAPTGVSASTSSGNATVTWTAPGSLGSGSFSTYVVEAYSGSTRVASAYSSSTSYTFTSLTPGTAYTFKVITQTYDPPTWNIAWSAHSSASNSVTP